MNRRALTGCLAVFALGAAGCQFPEISVGAAPDDGGSAASMPADATTTDAATASTDDGGTTDAEPVVEASIPDASAPVADASDLPDGACDFNGTWGSRITIDVSWAPQGLTSVILAPGSGQIRQWVKGIRTQSGTSSSDTSVVCDIELPDFAETLIAGGETYGVRFPPSLFDDGYLPPFTVTGGLSSLFPGASYGTTTTAVLLGITMMNPTTDPWPATVTTEADMDQDGKPGVTAAVAQGAPYSDVPTGIGPLPPPKSANSLYLAIREVTVVSANVVDCDHMVGTVQIPQLPTPTGGTKYAIDSHILGCALDDGSGDCTSAQAAFVDNSQPVFSPATPAMTDFHSVRMSTGATCAQVRMALP